MREEEAHPEPGHILREIRRRQRRLRFAKRTVALIILVSTSVFLLHSMLNESSQNPTINSTPTAVIVDQLSLTYPNHTFVQTATKILVQAGFRVEYYSGEDVTVDFYRSLPTKGYTLIVLRAHSTATWSGNIEGPVSFFTSERYSTTKHVYEQLTDQVGYVAFSEEEYQRGIRYFGITPLFVLESMTGRFHDPLFIMMGCDGMKNPLMAKALVKQGVSVYVGWNGQVSAGRTDSATIRLLQNLILEKETTQEAVEKAMSTVGPDLVDNSILEYYVGT